MQTTRQSGEATFANFPATVNSLSSALRLRRIYANGTTVRTFLRSSSTVRQAVTCRGIPTLLSDRHVNFSYQPELYLYQLPRTEIHLPFQ